MGKGIKLQVTPTECRLIRVEAARLGLVAPTPKERNAWASIRRTAEKAIAWFEDDRAPTPKELRRAEQREEHRRTTGLPSDGNGSP